MSEALAAAALSARLPEENIRRLGRQIHADMLAHSRNIREPNYTRIGASDLEFLFEAYDRHFWGGLCRQSLSGRRLTFRLASRMTISGGQTTVFRHRNGEVFYEIAMATTLLFDGFNADSRPVAVCGIHCADRLEALQHIFEHETVHLIEQLCWQSSNCSEARFQDIARRSYLHEAHTHALVTRRERAAKSGIPVGAMVTFSFEGQPLSGFVNRITQRATVLVEDPAGVRYSNGKHYRKYYVPIASLRPLDPLS